MTTLFHNPRILLVEDEALIGLAEKNLFTSIGYKVDQAFTGEAAVRKIKSSSYDLVLMDINLGPGIDGGEAARQIRELDGPPVVFLTSHTEESAIDKTRDSGAYGFIMKGSGDQILLASTRMALGLAAALRGLAESEERWSSLARTAPDTIFSIGPDRKILFMNKLNGQFEGREASSFLGSDFADLVMPEDRAAFVRAIERVFEGTVTERHHVRVRDLKGAVGYYEVFLGPVREGSRVVNATAVMRDITGEHRLAAGEPLDAGQRETEVRAAMAGFDYSPMTELLVSFQKLTGAQASIMSRDDAIYATNARSRACEFFHNGHPETLSNCIDSNHWIESKLPGLAIGEYVEYRCANGLRDIAQPLFVEGVHWGTLFLGQFLFDDDKVDEAELIARAEHCGWDVADYLSAMREVPRFSHERIGELLSFLKGIGRIFSELAFGAFKERVRSRNGGTSSAGAD